MSDHDWLDELKATVAATKSREERIVLLLKGAQRLKYPQPHAGIELAERALRLARSIGSRIDVARSLRLIGLCHSALSETTQAVKYISKSIAICVELGDRKEEALGIDGLARAHVIAGNIREGEALFERILGYYEEIGNRRAVAILLHGIGSCRLELGDYEKAVELLLRSAEMFQEMGDEAWEGSVCVNIATAYHRIGDDRQELKYMARAAELRRAMPGHADDVALFIGLSASYIKSHELEKALEHARQGVELSRKIGNRDLESQTLSLQAYIHARRGERDDAVRIAVGAEKVLDACDEVAKTVEVLINIAEAWLLCGEPARAIGYLQRALASSELRERRQKQTRVYGLLADAYEALGDYRSALEHHRHFARVTAELANHETQQAIAEMQRRLDLEKSEREKEIYRLKMRNLEAEVEHRNRELSAMTLSMQRIDNLHEKMKGRITRVLGERRSVAEEILRDLLRDVESERANGGMHHNFVAAVNEVQQRFHHELSQRYPSLTPTELRVCSLLRGNMTTKEIADLLGVTTRSIEGHRYNIRKKIDLPQGVSLTAFLISL